MTGESDESLALKIRELEAAALSELYDRFAPRIYAMARHTLGSSEAEKALQDVFLRLWTRAATYDAARGPFSTWFMSIARHRILDGLRRRTLTDQLAALRQTEDLLACQVDPAVDVEGEVWERERGAAVARALAALPAEQRQVLVLAYFGGLTQSMLADHLKWPLGTVKKRTRLGLQKLKAILGRQGWAAESFLDSSPVERDRAK